MMQNQMLIPAPSRNISATPDENTKTGLSDHTAPSAPGRVFHLNLHFFKYGTDDKSHAAAIFFSLLLLLIIAGVIFSSVFVAKDDWLQQVFPWLGSAFMFTAGVALGSKEDT